MMSFMRSLPKQSTTLMNAIKHHYHFGSDAACTAMLDELGSTKEGLKLIWRTKCDVANLRQNKTKHIPAICCHKSEKEIAKVDAQYERIEPHLRPFRYMTKKLEEAYNRNVDKFRSNPNTNHTMTLGR